MSNTQPKPPFYISDYLNSNASKNQKKRKVKELRKAITNTIAKWEAVPPTYDLTSSDTWQEGLQMMKDLLISLEIQAAYKKRNYDAMVQYGKLSDLKDNAYGNLGITERTVVGHLAFIKEIKDNLKEEEMYESVTTFWEEYDVRETAARQLPLRRMFGTGGLMTMMGFTSGIADLFAKLGISIPIIHCMSQEIPRDDPVVITYKNEKEHSTFLVDKVDVFWTGFKVPKEAGPWQESDLEKKHKVLDLLENKAFNKLLDDECFLLFYCERKAIDTKQVQSTMAQCVILMHEFNKREISWCLTNGYDYTFGTISGDETGRTTSRTEVYSITNHDIERIDMVFLMFSYWMLTPFKKIDSMLSELEVAVELNAENTENQAED